MVNFFIGFYLGIRAAVRFLYAKASRKLAERRLVGMRGLEPPTSASRTLRASQLRYIPKKTNCVRFSYITKKTLMQKNLDKNYLKVSSFRGALSVSESAGAGGVKIFLERRRNTRKSAPMVSRKNMDKRRTGNPKSFTTKAPKLALIAVEILIPTSSSDHSNPIIFLSMNVVKSILQDCTAIDIASPLKTWIKYKW